MSRMDFLGEVETITHDGLLVVRTYGLPDGGDAVYDNRKRKLGRVKRVFGPVERPFISIAPTDKSVLTNVIGRKTYFQGENRHAKSKRGN